MTIIIARRILAWTPHVDENGGGDDPKRGRIGTAAELSGASHAASYHPAWPLPPKHAMCLTISLYKHVDSTVIAS